MTRNKNALSERLYNGIVLPTPWPPCQAPQPAYEPMPVPYLDHPPAVIPIDLGRQLFVDDFLIAETTLARVFHQARKYAGNPVFEPETAFETQGVLPAATPKGGGVWWDPAWQCFRMWYEAGWLNGLAHAVSRDGLRWERSELDVLPPTNRLVPDLTCDSGTVFIDHDHPDPAQRYKMLLRSANEVVGHDGPGYSLVSADGIHWSAPVKTGPMGDRSTMFYNPFRGKWVYSIRAPHPCGVPRARRYREHADFLAGAAWTPDDCVFWTGADRLDLPDPAIGDTPQLYNLDAVAYESILLGLFEIHLGPANEVCEARGIPKTTELMTAFSRDGFHWSRPDRRAFIPAARRAGEWDRGYVQSVGGLCLVMGDELWFYYTGFRGDCARRDKWGFGGNVYGNGSTGLAMLRRDGFASLSAGADTGSLLTRPVSFSGEHLFVNVDNPQGALTVDVCAETGEPLKGFTRADCLPIAGDSTRQPVAWRGGKTLAGLAGCPMRFRFHLSKGDLYAFWVSLATTGESGGYVAAGGPGFAGAKEADDTHA